MQHLLKKKKVNATNTKLKSYYRSCKSLKIKLILIINSVKIWIESKSDDEIITWFWN